MLKNKKLMSEALRSKILLLFEELDVPKLWFGWRCASDKKIFQYYQDYVRVLTFCIRCNCLKVNLRKEIDEAMFEDAIWQEK